MKIRSVREELCDQELAAHGVQVVEPEVLHEQNRARLFQAVLDSFPDAIVFSLDKDYRYLAFNDKHRETMRAVSGHDIAPGMCMLDLLGKRPVREKARRGFDRALAGEAFVTEEIFGKEAHAQRVWQIHCSPVRDEAGQTLGVTCLSLDITERRRCEERLAQREREFRNLVENVPDNIARWDAEGRPLYFNPTLERTLGTPCVDVAGKPMPVHFDPLTVAIGQVVATGQPIHSVRQPVVDGSTELHVVTLVPEFDEAGRVASVLGVSRDMTDIYRLQDALAAREREFRTLVEHSPDTVARFGRDLRWIYVNPAVAALTVGGTEALIGKKLSEYPGGPHALDFERNLAEVRESGKEREFELTWSDLSGREYCSLVRLTPEFGNDGMVESIMAVGRDISELNASRRKIHQMAYYDTLTSLPNRALFNDRLREMIDNASGHGQRAGVMLIDIDRFKTVNDTMGHPVGDELLCEAATRLTDCVRAGDTVARLGGDEFAILLPETLDGDDFSRIAARILRQFNEPFSLNGKEVYVSCSVGIAVYPDDSTEAHDLMKYVDSAMYFAKRSGRNNFRFYSRNLTDCASESLMLESELRHAIDRGLLELYYQPKVLLEDGATIGSEALLRWRHPQLGMIPPGRFIQVAEDTGLIVDMGKWVLHEACRSAVEWNAGDGSLHKVAINLSARQFQTGDLVATVVGVLEVTACHPTWIELEITESLLLDDGGKTLGIFNALRAMGIAIAIDDFGTGYSALSYLARFPIDTLKIDRSFIQGVTTEKHHAELVKAILSIARCLGQEVVAEGVETDEQARFLQEHGCRIAQGYLYSKPLPKAEMTSLLRQCAPICMPAAPVTGASRDSL